MEIWILILGLILGAASVLFGIVWLVRRGMKASGKAYMDAIDKM